MVRLCKRFDFDAAHFLPNVSRDHKCHRIHGHTYRVDVICEGEPDNSGMVIDYEQIAAAWKPIHDIIDHRLLNEIIGLTNPTTEILAPWILRKMRRFVTMKTLVAIRVYESSTTWCEVTI